MNIKISCKIFVRFHAGAIALAALLALPVSPVFAATSISLTDDDVSNGVITLKNDNNADLAGNLSATETTPAISVKSTKGNNIVIEGSVGNVESIATTGTADAYGILAQTSGDITINLESGNITVGDAINGRNGITANTNTTPDTGEGNIGIKSDLTINVTSVSGGGIYSTANSGNISVENSGTITSTKAYNAIYARTVTGNVDISNIGSLFIGETPGGSAGAITAYVDFSPAGGNYTATSGTIKVYNDGRIETAKGGDLPSIRAYSGASEGNIEIFLDENSEIVSNYAGIKGGLLNPYATGDMIVKTRGGSINVGSEATASAASGVDYGMYLLTQTGKRVVDIEDTSIHIWIGPSLTYGCGPAINAGQGGDAYISVRNATIRSDAHAAIYANGSGDVGGSHIYIGYNADGTEVPLTGKFVSTYAQNSNAFGVIHAQTVNTTGTGTGAIDISVGDAEIIANEEGKGAGVAMGIAAIKTSTGIGGDIHIKTSAETTIKTWGDNLSTASNGSTYGASGILARNAGNGNKIDIDNSATITTHGNGAKGIFAYSASDGVETKIRNAGDITTSGTSAHGIYVNGYSTGSVDLVNTGTVSVNASNAYGIYVTDVASGTVVNEGTVSNTATGGTAIHVEANNVELILAGGPASLYEDRAAQVVGHVTFAGSGNKLSLGANVQDIAGNLTFTSTSTFEVSAQSLDDYQRLVVTGVSALAGATLVFDDTGVEAEALHNGDVFTLINGISISGIFGGYNEGATYTSQGGNDYTISYLSGNVTLTAIVNAVAVPEPATCAVLAGLAMLMLAAARRGQRG